MSSRDSPDGISEGKPGVLQGNRIKMMHCSEVEKVAVWRETPAAGSTPNIERPTPNFQSKRRFAFNVQHFVIRHSILGRWALGVGCWALKCLPVLMRLPWGVLDTRGDALVKAAALMKAKVIVMPKLSILDPQGVAVREAMRHHGMPGVKSVRVGKMIDVEVDGADEAAMHEICRELLSNPVVEDYQLVLEK